MARRRPLPTEPVEAIIETIGRGGMGVGRPLGDGAAGGAGARMLIKGTLPGERVRARARTRRRGFTVYRLEEVLQAAPQRVTPACPAFADCGGCAWQHVDTDEQLRRKHAEVIQLFEASAVRAAAWLPAVAGPRFGYRHKARLGVRWVPQKGGALVGFREPGSNKIAELDTCAILAPSLAVLIAPVRKLIAQLSAPRSVPQLEVAAGDSDCAMIVRHLEPLTAADLAHWREFADRHAVQVLLQPGGPDSVQPLPDSLADAGPAPAANAATLLQYAAGNLQYRFHPLQFTQVNPAINRALMAALHSHLQVAPDAHVLDLFCGLGNFSLPLAQRAGHVIGVEADAGLVAQAGANAALNGIGNVEFKALDLYAEPALAWLADSVLRDTDVLLLDPPRSGAGPLAQVIAAAGPPQVAYISCNPATLAADAQVLLAGGYRLRAAGLFDMFPHTAHVEVLAVFERR